MLSADKLGVAPVVEVDLCVGGRSPEDVRRVHEIRKFRPACFQIFAGLSQHLAADQHRTCNAEGDASKREDCSLFGRGDQATDMR